jgi:F-type H+-transporting ATPase subunit epsilon
MAALFTFEVHTFYRLFYSDKVETIVLPISDGEIGILANRSPFTAPVLTGILRIKDKQGVWQEAFITEGILEVKEHKTVLLVDAAEWPDEIDYERAVAAKARAEENIKSSLFKFEALTEEATLKRAETRIKAWGLKKPS